MNTKVFWRRIIVPPAFLVLFAGFIRTADAQTKITNREFVRNLFFLPPLDQQETEAITAARIDASGNDSADQIARFVGLGISSVPPGSSSASFSSVKNSLGDLKLKNKSFGPVLSERPLTNGKGVVNFGFNYNRAVTNYNQDFDTQDGRTTGIPLYDNRVVFLDDGKVQFVTRRAFLKSTVNTVNLFGSVGLNNKVDVGISVPVLSVELSGHINEKYDISRTFGAPTTRGQEERNLRGQPAGILEFPVQGNPGTSQSATGIGDIIIRSKFSLLPQDDGDGAAVTMDLSLPTGDPEQFLGSRKTAARFLFVGSKAFGEPSWFSVYGNGGYRFAEAENEAQYSAGVDFMVIPRPRSSTPRMSVSAAFLGRYLSNSASLQRVQTVAHATAENLGNTEPGDPNPEQSSVELWRFFWVHDSAYFNKVSAEFKLKLTDQWLLTGAVLIPVNHTGLQPKTVPIIGLEWVSCDRNQSGDSEKGPSTGSKPKRQCRQ